MQRGKLETAAGATLALLIAGCGSGESDGAPSSPVAVVDLVVDADRDGRADPGSDVDRLEDDAWDASRGAIFLANYDDDDGDGVADADDTEVDGPEDEADLARVVVRPWPEAPDGASGTVTLLDPDPEVAAHTSDDPARHVRLFRREPAGGWTLVAGQLEPCAYGAVSCAVAASFALDTAELRAGVELGLEARHFAGTVAAADWSGEVRLELAVTVGAELVTTDESPDGRERARLRVAPWMSFGSLSVHDTLYSSDDDPAFVAAVGAAAGEAGLDHRPLAGWDDPWTEDWMQPGYAALPAEDGLAHGMRVALARPWGRGFGPGALPAAELAAMHLGPDRGYLEPCERAGDKCPLHTGEMHYGTTFDSYGNHELVPASAGFPAGRIVYGSGVLQTTRAFYAAQAVQAPFDVDTSWLWVGHVDEVFGYVPAATARGWKVLVASPSLARQMLEAWQAQGHGSAVLFAGKQSWNGASAAITIDALLADVALAQAQQEAESFIDAMVERFRTELGLADDELVPMPFFYGEVDGYKVAYIPGTVNARVFGDHILVPDPFGPVIDGVDGFRQDLLDRLGTPAHALGATGQGLDVRFVDDWDSYHLLGGEVHCATNEEGPPPAEPRWWEVAGP
ncbi:MAG: hypothetical protein HY908_29660 [Myxococcales bacterium]|nr:hypothetical protein [Myxococcales bacterium]